MSHGFIPTSASGAEYAASIRCGSLSAPADAGPGLLDEVLVPGGLLPAATVDRRIVDEVLGHGTGLFFNGADYAPPNPYWPTLHPPSLPSIPISMERFDAGSRELWRHQP